ncbi:MAG TPA: DUF4389 domain-containing protein [Acidimicrobiales bacterium]|jgi:hypothetical protein
MADTAVSQPSRRAEIWFDDPAPQRRWSVLLRIVLVLPPLVFLLILEVVLVLVAVIGWLVALLLGRLPRWAHIFIGGVARYEALLEAYALLLTDRVPRISLGDSDYPARPVVPPNGPLRTSAVFFRFILVIPAAALGAVVLLGLIVPAFVVTWLIVLSRGQMPASLHGAYAALVRYLFRLRSYAFLLTPEYPWGMLGDQVPGAPAVATASPEEAAAPVPPPAQPAWLPAAPRPPRPPDRGGLVVAGAARRWLIVAIVWGSILFVGNLVLQTVLISSSVTATSQGNTVVNGFNQTRVAIDRAIRDRNRCSAKVTAVCFSVVRASHKAAATSLDDFESDLRSLSVPGNARGPLRVLARETAQLTAIFNRLAHSADSDAYAMTFVTNHVNARLRSLPRQTNRLLRALNAHVYY